MKMVVSGEKKPDRVYVPLLVLLRAFIEETSVCLIKATDTKNEGNWVT